MTKLRGNQIFRVQRDGTFTVLAGTGAAGTGDGPAPEATFTRPNGIAVSPAGDEVWVNGLTSGPGLGRGVSVVSMRRISMVSLTDVMNALGPDAGVEAIRQAHSAYHALRQGEDSSAGAIALGYSWLTAGRIAEGVELFSLNANLFATDANSLFHFGEAYRFTGRPEEAAEQHRRVLSIDPEHGNASARLVEVSGG